MKMGGIKNFFKRNSSTASSARSELEIIQSTKGLESNYTSGGKNLDNQSRTGRATQEKSKLTATQLVLPISHSTGWERAIQPLRDSNQNSKSIQRKNNNIKFRVREKDLRTLQKEAGDYETRIRPTKSASIKSTESVNKIKKSKIHQSIYKGENSHGISKKRKKSGKSNIGSPKQSKNQILHNKSSLETILPEQDLKTTHDINNNASHAIEVDRTSASLDEVGSKDSSSVTQKTSQTVRLAVKRKSTTIFPNKHDHCRKMLKKFAKQCDSYRKELGFQQEINYSQQCNAEEKFAVLNGTILNLQNEIHRWKGICKQLQEKNSHVVQVKRLSKQNKELECDIESLKCVISRLNVEILRFQPHFRSDDTPLVEASHVDNEEDEEDVGWLRKPRKKLIPLLTAYDEVIKEKDDIISNYEESMAKFKAGVHDIIQENDQLHKTLCEKKNTITDEEWKLLQKNAEIVLEENDMLQQKVIIYQKKIDTLIQVANKKISKYEDRTNELEGENGKMRSVIKQLEHEVSVLAEHNSKLLEEARNRVSKKDHEKSLSECQTLLETLRTNYGKDRTDLKSKINELEETNEKLTRKIEDLKGENLQMEKIMTDIETESQNAEENLKSMNTELSSFIKKREEMESVLKEMITIAEGAMREKEMMEESLSEQKAFNVEILQLKAKHSDLLSDLQQKIEVMKQLHIQETHRLNQKIKSLQEDLDTIEDKYRLQINHLNKTLEQKDQVVGLLEQEKRQAENDLETVWKISTNKSL